jgi:hypothetical protein
VKNFSGQILPGRATNAKMLIGRVQRADNSYGMFEGAIDEVRLWSTARTAQQLTDNATVAQAPGPQGWCSTSRSTGRRCPPMWRAMT